MSSFRTFTPFHDRDIQDVFSDRISDMVERIERYTDDEILANDVKVIPRN